MRYPISFTLIVVLAAGCRGTPTQPTPNCTFGLSPTTMTVGPAGGAASLTVSTQAGCAWTARADAAWLSIASGASGTGSGTVGVTASANADVASRAGTVTVGGATATVTQQGQPCSYAVTPVARTFEAGGGQGQVTVTAAQGCAWSAASGAGWLSITAGTQGSGSGVVTYQVAANAGAAARDTAVTVGGMAHTVTQSGAPQCPVTIAPDDEAFAAAGGAGAFVVNAAAGCGWIVASTVTWAHVTNPPGGAGTGTQQVTYTVDASSELGSRSGTLTVGGQTFAITQAGTLTCTYSVSPTAFSECLRGGFPRAFTVDTQAGCPWTVGTSAAWLSLAVPFTLGATGSGTASFTFGDNYGPAREGTIEVRWPAPTAGQNVRVSQAGCLYAAFPDNFDVAASGGDVSFDVFASPTDPACGGPLQDACVWSAQASAGWVTVLTAMPGNGDRRVTVRVAANTTGSARTTTVVAGTTTITIRQAG